MRQDAVPASRSGHSQLPLNQLLRQTLIALLYQATRCVRRFRRPRIAENATTVLKPYEKPTLRKVTLEQARLLVLGNAVVGDQPAHELVDLIFPSGLGPNPQGSDRPGQVGGAASG